MSNAEPPVLCEKCGESLVGSLTAYHECKLHTYEKYGAEVKNELGFVVKPRSTKGMKFDTGKLQYSLIPTSATKALAQVLTFGAQKYAPNNWMLVEDGETRYLDALYRHLEAFRSGEDIDPESGLHHLSHALTNVAFLHWLETDKEGNQ